MPRMNRENFLRLLEEEQRSLVPDVSDFEGNIYDFVGQALWGFTEQATFGTLAVSDAIAEARRGDAAYTWEEAITGLAGGQAGSWDELTDMGRAGYSVGAAFGQIPSFFAGGILTSTAVKSLSKLGAAGTKMAITKSTKELIDAGKNIAVKKGIDVSKALAGEVVEGGKRIGVARKIIDDAYEYSAGANSIRAIEGNMASELYEKTMINGLRVNIAKVLNISDNQMLDDVAKSTFDIITKNNPDDALALLQMTASKVPGLRERPGAALVLGSMAYDAGIGFTLGTMRAGVSEMQAAMWNVRANDYGEMKRQPGLYEFNAADFSGRWISQSLHEAAFFAPLGAVKFVKGFGGTSAGHLKRLSNMIKQSARAYMKPLKNYTNVELRSQLTAMDEIAGGYLNIGRGTKFEKMGRQWWLKGGEADANTKLMKEYLGKIRKEYITKAPFYWTKEFGTDVLASLPRMGAGVMAMHGPHIISSFWNNGLSKESLSTAMGGSMPEIASNIFTAMYFTRKPHSFNIEATPGMFGRMFQTGQIPAYFNAKQSKLRKMVGGLNTFGVDQAKMSKVLNTYGYKSLDDFKHEQSDTIIKRAIDDSPELNQIKTILDPHIRKEVVDGVDLRTAFNKHISDMIKSGEITYEESLPLYDKLFVAQKIIDIHNQNSPEKFNVDSVRPEDAYDIATKLSEISFDGETLNRYNPDEQITSWVEKTIRDAVKQPQNILKNYILETYRALGIEVEANEFGIIKGPRLDKVDFGDSFMNNIFATIYDGGVNNNWIDPLKAPPIATTMISGEAQTKAITAHKAASDQMMDLVYGHGWEARAIENDPLILQNDAWHITYNDYLKVEQRRNAYEIFTGGKDHNTTALEATDIRKAIEDLILSRAKPIVTKDDGAVSDYGEVSLFIDNLHEIAVGLEPAVQRKIPRTISQDEASGLMEKTRSLVGDLFTNPKSLKDFKEYIFNKSVQNLGLNDMFTGIDTKASIISLKNDIGFNYQEAGTKLIFPDRLRIASKLQTAFETGKISQEAYDQLLKHYDSVFNAIDNSGFPVEFRSDVLEQNTGDWIKALTKSMSDSANAIDIFSNDKARQAASFLENEIDKMNVTHEQIKLGADNIDPAIRERAAKDIQSMGELMKTTTNLATLIKTALIERNTAVLDAAARKEGDIHRVMDILNRDPLNSDKSKYMQEILEIKLDIEKEAQNRILNEDSIKDLIRKQLSEYDVPDKDLRDNHMRITSSQFQIKYNISKNYLDKLFDIDRSARKNKKEIRDYAESVLGDFYRNPENLPNAELRRELIAMTRMIEGAAENIPMNDVNFQRFVVDPLRLAVRVNLENIDVNLRPSWEVLDSDIYSITSAYFSKIPIKTLKVDLSSNHLIQNSKIMGDVGDRGLMGIINYLDSGQNHIYVVENAGIDLRGKPIRDINGFDLENINAALNSGNFTIRNPQGKADYYKHGDATTLKDVDRRAPDIAGFRYKIIPINETTSLIVRMDAGKGSIRESIQEQFSTDGELFKKLEAIFDGDLSGDSARSVRDLLENIRNATTDNSVVEAVKLTRLILDLPHAIDKVIDNGSISLDHDFIKDSFKRAKLVEPKNGFIPTDKNISRAASMYRNAESEFHRNIHERLSEWYTPDADGNYKRLRTLSIDDEVALVDANGNKLDNIFSSLDRVRESLREQFKSGEIDEVTRDFNLDLADAASKSIVDGEMFLSKDAYLFAMSLIGIHPDMVRTDLNGNITGFKSGGIKPTITYSDIVFDRSATDYGKVQTWFAKTAFKYNPLLDNLMQNLGIDALTFKSGNKINTLKERAGEDYNDKYAEMIGIGAAETETLSRPWHEYLSVDRIVGDHRNSIMELPWESMSLRTISSEHDPLVGANTGVHFSHDNGIADWIGVDQKIQSYNHSLATMYTNPFYRTALARKILGAQAETGDPSMMNTAVSSILSREGVIMEPWAQRRLEDAMISYFINNGGIAGGIVPDGSLDVMTADMGNLGVTIRSSIEGRPTVQFFGEFLPSYYSASKKFKKAANQINGVGNILIQRINYIAEGNKPRIADAFMVEIGAEKFLQIEGRAINKDGNIIELDNFSVIKGMSEKSRVANKRGFNDALALDTRGMDMMIDGTSLAKAALMLDVEKIGLSVGTLNSRQPRNMIGDIVISKIAVAEGADGIRRAHVDESAGNVSRMNHIDAIKPQDADFDFDKSFNYIAAPGLFWREVNRAAGHITQETVEGALDGLFNPNLESWRLSKTIPDLVSGGTRNDQVMHEVNLARGRFIKMHQTATYLSNIFRRYPGVLKFTADFIEGPNKTLTVRLNQNGRYSHTVDNISRMAKEYIDVYKNLPSDKSVEQIDNIQNQIFFGERGLFEIVTEKAKRPGVIDKTHPIDLNGPDFRDVRTAIRRRIIDPLNVYLKYNRGVYEDPSGITSKATLKNYNDAYIEMANSFDLSNLAHIDPRINMKEGLISVADYFVKSKNSYDVAMDGLHKVYQSTSNLRQQGQYGKGLSESKDIIDYIEGGYEAVLGESYTAKHNRVFNNALREYVKDEARALKLHDLARQETHLKLEIENKEAFIKGDPNENLAVQRLREQLSRVQEVKRTMEEAISYKFGDFDDNPVLKYHQGFNKGVLTPVKKPYVVIDSKGEIKEVILVGRYNQKPIYKSDKVVENGKRFEVTDGDVQKGLRVLFQAFTGIPKLIDVDGNVTRIHKGEMNNIIRDYKALQRETILLDLGVGREGRAQYALDRERAIYDALFNHPATKDNEAYRKALILQMIIPSASNKVVSIRSLNNDMGKQAVYDYIYQQNPLSEPVMSLLSKIEVGEHKGDVKFAKSVLDDINTLKLVSLLNSENPNIDFELVKTRMFTEPASLDGFMTQEKYLNQDIYAKTRVSDEITRTAAEVMVNYANGGGLVDPVILYKASRQMARNGIDYAEQWANKVYVAEQDGTTREFGLKKHLISEHDSIHRKDLGERGGQGESTTKRVKDIFDCMGIK